jgi:ankyrin repeat protein
VIEERENRAALHRAIQALPDHQRGVVLLYYLSSYSQQEIADFLEVPVATVKTRLHHARKQLKLRITTLNDLSAQRPSRDNQFTEKVMRLFEATKTGDIDHVRKLLAEDASLAQASGYIRTAVWGADAHALHVAVMHGRKDIVDLLLAHGADINARDDQYRFTALIHAIDLADFMPEYAKLGMVDFLLERGAERDVWACWWQGDRAAVKTWLERDPSLVNQVGPGPSTLLSFCRDIEAIDFLLGYGADPLVAYDRPGQWGSMSPLRDMAYRGNYAAVNHLLAHRGIEVDVFLASIMGDTAAVQALVTADPQLAQAPTSADHVLGPRLTALHLAAQGGHANLAQWLLDHGADVNARGYKDFTPLHFAIRFGPKKLLDPLPDLEQSTQGVGVYRLLTAIPRLLIDNGADLAARDSERHLTPLGLAQSSFEDETDRSAVIALLESVGAPL